MRKKKLKRTYPNRDAEKEARAIREIIAYAKSDFSLPSAKMINAVNHYLKRIDRRRVRCPIGNAVPHRRIMAEKLTIEVIRWLTPEQLKKVDETLYRIASIYVRIYKTFKLGKDWQADIAVNDKSKTMEIEPSVAKDFHQGLLSMADVAQLAFPEEFPLKNKESI